jgi:hypothetical protein
MRRTDGDRLDGRRGGGKGRRNPTCLGDAMRVGNWVGDWELPWIDFWFSVAQKKNKKNPT